MKETTEAKEPLKNRKAALMLIKNEKWQPARQPKKLIRAIINKDLPLAA